MLACVCVWGFAAGSAAEAPAGLAGRRVVLRRAQVVRPIHLGDFPRDLLEGAVLPHVQPHAAAHEAHVPVVHLEHVSRGGLSDLRLPEGQDDRPRLVAHRRFREPAGRPVLRGDLLRFADADHFRDQVHVLAVRGQLLHLRELLGPLAFGRIGGSGGPLNDVHGPLVGRHRLSSSRFLRWFVFHCCHFV